MKVSEVAEELKGFGCNEDKVTKLLVKMGLLEEDEEKYQVGDVWLCGGEVKRKIMGITENVIKNDARYPGGEYSPDLWLSESSCEFIELLWRKPK